MAAIKKYITSSEAYNRTEGMDDSIYYVGSAADIKAMYKSIVRKWRKNRTDICPLYDGTPKFDGRKQVYALRISKDSLMTVVNSDTMLSLILAGDVIPA